MKRVTMLLAATLIVCPIAKAQVNAVNMRSGVGTVVVPGGSGDRVASGPLFAVPEGARFVLTDLQIINVRHDLLSYHIKDDQGLLRWPVARTSSQPDAQYAWATGLVFEPTRSVVMETRTSANLQDWPVDCWWSGYLVTEGVTSAQDNATEQVGLELSPNPSQQAVILRFELGRSVDVSLAIYDVSGRRVRTLASGRMASGAYVKSWDGRDEGGRLAPSGVYFARLDSSDSKSVRRLARVR